MDFGEFAAMMGGRIANPARAEAASAMPRGRPATATATGLPVQPAARGAVVAPQMAAVIRRLQQEIARLRSENAGLRQQLAQAQEAAKTAWRGRGQEVEESDVVEVEDSTVSEVASDINEADPWGPDEGA